MNRHPRTLAEWWADWRGDLAAAVGLVACVALALLGPHVVAWLVR